ncbi:uncharacterized protein LOC141831267 [Curcuma longa]|uniref:uncharacterized protein LOC141831267 n=1 Tax=Curcuma longa TaxID=136217 RepID=UPI003D9E931C
MAMSLLSIMRQRGGDYQTGSLPLLLPVVEDDIFSDNWLYEKALLNFLVIFFLRLLEPLEKQFLRVGVLTKVQVQRHMVVQLLRYLGIRSAKSMGDSTNNLFRPRPSEKDLLNKGSLLLSLCMGFKWFEVDDSIWRKEEWKIGEPEYVDSITTTEEMKICLSSWVQQMHSLPNAALTKMREGVHFPS